MCGKLSRLPVTLSRRSSRPVAFQLLTEIGNTRQNQSELNYFPIATPCNLLSGSFMTAEL